MGDKMVTSKELLLVIENDEYDEFNGFCVRFIGFDKIPYPFSPLGWPRGKLLLIELKKALGNFNLIVLKEGESHINTQHRPTSVVLALDDFRRLYRSFWQISRLCQERAMNESVNSTIPEMFGKEREVTSELPEDIRNIVPSRDQLEKVNNFLRNLRYYDLSEEDTFAFFMGGSAFHSVHLENVLKEFTPIAVEIPDFLLISVEGYVDIYEIKLPKTELLNLDKSHNTYYWSSDISKALSQTEKYISSLDGDRASLEKKIRQKYQLELSILRPRGYIIAGNSNQLSDSDKRDDFRILNESLKNTCIMPYDTFLRNFENLAKALQDYAQ
jgi:hypothetical protein